MNGWMDGVGSLQRVGRLSESKPGQPSVFPTESGLSLLSRDCPSGAVCSGIIPFGRPLGFSHLEAMHRFNIQESEKEAFLL